MTKEEAQRQILEAGRAVETASLLLKAHIDFFRRYAKEARDMNSFGPIVDPSLFMSSERRAIDAAIGPIFAIALRFAEEYNAHIHRTRTALEKVGCP